MTPQARRVLQLRLLVSQAAVKKFEAVAQRAHEGRIHNTLQLNGASRTKRWSGRGLQLQNLKRPTIPNPEVAADMVANGDTWAFLALFDDAPLEALGSCIRGVICSEI